MQYPLIQFYKGSLVRLASGELKQVEDLSSDDFLESAKQIDVQIESGIVKAFFETPPSPAPSMSPSGSTPSPNLITHNTTVSSTVLIKFYLESNKSVIFIEVPVEHPFFVFHRGWSSCNPQQTLDKFNLKCRKLKIGDTCVSLITTSTQQQQPLQQQPQPQPTPPSPLPPLANLNHNHALHHHLHHLRLHQDHHHQHQQNQQQSLDNNALTMPATFFTS